MRLHRAHPILGRPRRRSLFAPIAIVLGLLMAISSTGVVFAWSDLSFSSADESLMITLTNQARASSGLKALLTDSTLTSIARTRAKYIYDLTWGYHCAYPNKTCATPMFSTLFYSSGYCFKVAGENLGYNNFPDDQTTQWQFNWFMGSPAHKANILGTTYDHIGVGAYKGNNSSSTYYHVFVMIFAQKCGTSPTPTRRPTPAPTPRPTATPRPTPRPTPVPTPRSTPHSGPTPTPGPNATPTPTITPQTTSQPTSTPDQVTLDQTRSLLADGLWWRQFNGDNKPPAGHTSSATPEPTADQSTGPTGSTGGNLGLQVIDPVPDVSLLDAIVGGVVSSYLGQ
jgi:uncharacterized protein YkwD